MADGVGEAVAGGVDLPEQPGRHRHVQPAELGVERLHVVAADGVPRGADWFGRPNRLVNQREPERRASQAGAPPIRVTSGRCSGSSRVTTSRTGGASRGCSSAVTSLASRAERPK